MFILNKKNEKRLQGEPDSPPITNIDRRDVKDENDVTENDDVTGQDGVRDYGSVNGKEADTDVLTKSDVQEEPRLSRKPEFTRIVILVTALSVHSIFEGLALGLQDSQSEVWTIFIAIAIHKALIAFSAGLQIAKMSAPQMKPVLISIGVFSVMSPLGATIGTILASVTANHNEESLGLSVAMLQSIATGTFMYVTFFEILAKTIGGCGAGNDVSQTGNLNCVHTSAVLLGFCLMAGLAFVQEP